MIIFVHSMNKLIFVTKTQRFFLDLGNDLLNIIGGLFASKSDENCKALTRLGFRQVHVTHCVIMDRCQCFDLRRVPFVSRCNRFLIRTETDQVLHTFSHSHCFCWNIQISPRGFVLPSLHVLSYCILFPSLPFSIT
jgi:hypothetical protein